MNSQPIKTAPLFATVAVLASALYWVVVPDVAQAASEQAATQNAQVGLAGSIKAVLGPYVR